jgi:hypothetical protein
MNYKDLFITPKIAEAPTDQEIQDAIRSYRNICLFQSDWTQLPDVNMANKSDWTVYRQQLRDMMAQNEDPKLIVFPEPPK